MPYCLPLMELLTVQGTALRLALTARERILGGHPEPIVEFRYTCGILCASYYVSNFLTLTDGLCLEGGQFSRQDLTAETVSLCKQFISDSLSAKR